MKKKRMTGILLTLCMAMGMAACNQTAPAVGVGLFSRVTGGTADTLTGFRYNGDAELHYGEVGSVSAELGYSAAKFSAQPERNNTPYAAEMTAVVSGMAQALEGFQLREDFAEENTTNKTPLPKGDYMNWSVNLKDINTINDLTIFATGDVYFCHYDAAWDYRTFHYKALDAKQYPVLKAAVEQCWATMDALPLDYQLTVGFTPGNILLPDSTDLRLTCENLGAVPIVCTMADFVVEKKVGGRWEPLVQKKNLTSKTVTMAARKTTWFAVPLKNYIDGRELGRYRLVSKLATPSESLTTTNEYEITTTDGYTSGPFPPEMTKENAAYCEKYMQPWGFDPRFRQNFDEDDYTVTFNMNQTFFFMTHKPDSKEKPLQQYMVDEMYRVPAQLLESTIQAHWLLTSQQMRDSLPHKAEGTDYYPEDYYDPANQTYCSVYGYGSFSTPVVTASSQDGNLLTLFCDWYDMGDNYSYSCEATIRLEDKDGYKYIANRAYTKAAIEE